ncbi:uncharacterized protein LOC123918887 [Trifolium pratense]|nr:uncharacterized protein LOC123912969 [Trifolium pratense]XP_045827011.1 uncharacterized protein LOC123918887 [Trifolium pratense]
MGSRNERRSTSFSGPVDWRNRRNLMSISELFSKLKDAFKKSDFSLVEETLIAREEMLKEEIEKMKRESELSAERMKFEKLERVTLEFKLEKIQEEMKQKALMKNGNDRGHVVPVKNRRVADGNGVASSADAVAGENVGVLVKDNKRVDEQSKKDRLVFRKKTLKEAVEEKVVGKLQENNEFKSWGRINVDIEVKADTGERRGEELVKVEEAPATELVCEKVDILAESLVVRKRMLKSAVKEMVGELEENNHFKSLGRINYEIEVKTVTGERCGKEFMKVGENGNGFGLDDGKVVKAGVGHEKGKFEVLKNRGVGDGEAPAPAEQVGEKVKVLAEKKRFIGEPGKKGCLGASDTERKSSSGAVQKNLDGRLAKPIAIPPDDAMRKAAIAEKIMLLQRKNHFKSSGRLNFDGEGETVNGESCGEKFVKDGKVVNAKLGHERCKLEVLKNSGVGDGEASAVAKLKDQKVEVLAEKKRLAGEPSKKDDLGSSGKMQKKSSGAVQENLATKPVESIGIKRDLANCILDLDSSDSSSSSSSSSSDGFDMDIPPLMSLSNKKLRTNGSQSTNELFTKLNKEA